MHIYCIMIYNNVYIKYLIFMALLNLIVTIYKKKESGIFLIFSGNESSLIFQLVFFLWLNKFLNVSCLSLRINVVWLWISQLNLLGFSFDCVIYMNHHAIFFFFLFNCVIDLNWLCLQYLFETMNNTSFSCLVDTIYLRIYWLSFFKWRLET